ncbi:unnamed protein product, partial [Closterium sp. NIES-54]
MLADPGTEAAALGANESALPGTTLAQALHTFTLDSGASRCFFRHILARSSPFLPCSAVLFGPLSGLHLPSFSTNLVSTAALQDAMVTTTTPTGQRVSICTCTRTGHHLATFTRRPGLTLYTLTTEPPQVAASGQVSASGTVAAPCSCRLLSHQTLLWHHRLGHLSLPRLRGMHFRLLVSGLPRSLPPLPPSPAPPCLPCVEGRQRAAPHSSFPIVFIDPSFDLVAESDSDCPPSIGGECALGTDVLEDRQEDFECLAAAVPHLVAMLLAPEGDSDAPDIPTPRSYTEAIMGFYSSQWQTAMDAEMASWKSTDTYVDIVPPLGANIGVDFFQTFSPTPKMTTLRVLLHVAAQHDYKLQSLDFCIAFLQGSLHEEIWLRRPPGFTGSFSAGTQWSLRRPVYGLCQAPRKWHDTVRTTLAALGFAPSTFDPSLYLRTNTSLPPFYILVYVDDLVFATAVTEALALVKLELQKRHTCNDL